MIFLITDASDVQILRARACDLSGDTSLPTIANDVNCDRCSWCSGADVDSARISLPSTRCLHGISCRRSYLGTLVGLGMWEPSCRQVHSSERFCANPPLTSRQGGRLAVIDRPFVTRAPASVARQRIRAGPASDNGVPAVVRPGDACWSLTWTTPRFVAVCQWRNPRGSNRLRGVQQASPGPQPCDRYRDGFGRHPTELTRRRQRVLSMTSTQT